MHNHLINEKNNCLINVINYNEKNDQPNKNMIKKVDLLHHNSDNIIYENKINVINSPQLSKSYNINELITRKEDFSKNEINNRVDFTNYKNYGSKNVLSKEINFSNNFYNCSNNILSSLSNKNNGENSCGKKCINKNEDNKSYNSENNKIKNKILRNRNLITNSKSEISDSNYSYKEKIPWGKSNYAINEKVKINTMLEFSKQGNSNLFYIESIKDENENTNFSLYKNEDNKYKDILNSNNLYYRRSNELNYYSTNDELKNDNLSKNDQYTSIKIKEFQIKNNELDYATKNKENTQFCKGISEKKLMNFKRNTYEQNNDIETEDKYTFNKYLLTDRITNEQLYPNNSYSNSNYSYLKYKRENLSDESFEHLKSGGIYNSVKNISDVHFSESFKKNKKSPSSLSIKNLNKNHLDKTNVHYNEENVEENNFNEKELNNLVKITKEVYSSNNFSSNSDTTVDCRSINNKIKNIDYLHNFKGTRNLNDLTNINILIDNNDIEHINNLNSSNNSCNLNNIENSKNINDINNLCNLDDIDNLKNINDINNLCNLDDIDNLKNIYNTINISNLSISNNSNNLKNKNNTINTNNLNNSNDIANTHNLNNITKKHDSNNINKVTNIDNLNNVINTDNLNNMNNINNKININNLSTSNNSDNLENINSITNTDTLNSNDDSNKFANNNNDINVSKLINKEEIKCEKYFLNNVNKIENNYSSYITSNEYNENQTKQNKKNKDEFKISKNELYLSKIRLQNEIDEGERIFFNSDSSNYVNKSNFTYSNIKEFKNKNKIKKKHSFEENSNNCINLNKYEKGKNNYNLNTSNFESKCLPSFNKKKSELNSCQIDSTKTIDKYSKDIHKNIVQLDYKELYTEEEKNNITNSLKSCSSHKDNHNNKKWKVVDKEKNSSIFCNDSNLYDNLKSKNIINIDNVDKNDNNIVHKNLIDIKNNIDDNFHKYPDNDKINDIKKNVYSNININYNENSVECINSGIEEINSRSHQTIVSEKDVQEKFENTVCNVSYNFTPISKTSLYREKKKKKPLVLKNTQDLILEDNIYSKSEIKICKCPSMNIKLENTDIIEEKKQTFDSNKDSKELGENMNIKLTGLYFNEQKTNTVIIAEALKIIDKKADDNCKERVKHLFNKELEEKKNECTDSKEIKNENNYKNNVGLYNKNFKISCLKGNNKATKINAHFISKQNNIPTYIEPIKNETIKNLKKLNTKYQKSCYEYEKIDNLKKLPKIVCEKKIKNKENHFLCLEKKNEKDIEVNEEKENKKNSKSSCYNSSVHDFFMHSPCNSNKINHFHCEEITENINPKCKKYLVTKKETNSFDNKANLTKYFSSYSKNPDLDKLNNEINIKKNILLKKKNIKRDKTNDSKYSIKKNEKKKVINNITNEKIKEVTRKKTEKYPLDIEATYKCKNIYLKINVDTSNQELIKHAQHRLSKRTLEFKLITTKLINGFIKSTESKIYKSPTIILQNSETDIFYNITLHVYSTSISTIWLYASISFFLTKYNIQNFKLKTPSSITFTKNGDFLNSLLNRNDVKKNISKNKYEAQNNFLKNINEKKNCNSISPKNFTEMNKKFDNFKEEKDDDYPKNYYDFSNTDISNESILHMSNVNICSSLGNENQPKNEYNNEDYKTMNKEKENSNEIYDISYNDECLSSSTYEELLLDFHDLNKSEIKNEFQNYEYEKNQEKRENKKLKHLNTTIQQNSPPFIEKNSSQKYNKNKDIIKNEKNERIKVNEKPNNYINNKINGEKIWHSMDLEKLNIGYKEPFIFSEFSLKQDVDVQNSNKLFNDLKIEKIKDSSSLTLSSSYISKDNYKNDMKNEELINNNKHFVIEDLTHNDKNNFRRKLSNSNGNDNLNTPLKKDIDDPNIKENICILNTFKEKLEGIKSTKNDTASENDMNITSEKIKIDHKDNSYNIHNNNNYKNYTEKNNIETNLSYENSNYINSLNDGLKTIPSYSNKTYKEKYVNVLNLKRHDEEYTFDNLRESNVMLSNKNEIITKPDFKLVKDSFIDRKENVSYENSNEIKEINEKNKILLDDSTHRKEKHEINNVNLNKMNNHEERTNNIKTEKIQIKEPNTTENFTFKKEAENLNEQHRILNSMYLNKNNSNELKKYENNEIKMVSFNNLSYYNNVEKDKNIIFTPNNANSTLINKFPYSTNISHTPLMKSSNFKGYMDYNNATFNPVDKKVILLKNKEMESHSKRLGNDALKYMHKSEFSKSCENIYLVKRDNNINRANSPINFLNKTFMNNNCIDNEDLNKKHFHKKRLKIYNSEDLLHKTNKSTSCIDNSGKMHDFYNNYNKYLNMQKNYMNCYPNNINSLNICGENIESNTNELVNNLTEYKKNNKNDIYHINKNETLCDNIINPYLINQNVNNYTTKKATDENNTFISVNDFNKNYENYVKEMEHKKSNYNFNKEFLINSQKLVNNKINNNAKDNILLNNKTNNNVINYNLINNNIPLNEVVNNIAINNNNGNIVHNLMKNNKYHNIIGNNNINRSKVDLISINTDRKKNIHNNINLLTHMQFSNPNYNIKSNVNSHNYRNGVNMLNFNKQRVNVVSNNKSSDEINIEPTYVNENKIKYIHNIDKNENELNYKNMLLKKNIYNINYVDNCVIENSPIKNILKKNIHIFSNGITKYVKENPYKVYKTNEQKLKNAIKNNYPFKNLNFVENMENNVNSNNITNIRSRDIYINQKNINNNLSNFNIDGNNNLNYMNKNINNTMNYLDNHSDFNLNFLNQNVNNIIDYPNQRPSHYLNNLNYHVNNNMNYLDQHSNNNLDYLNKNINNNLNTTNKIKLCTIKKSNFNKLNSENSKDIRKYAYSSGNIKNENDINLINSTTLCGASENKNLCNKFNDLKENVNLSSHCLPMKTYHKINLNETYLSPSNFSKMKHMGNIEYNNINLDVNNDYKNNLKKNCRTNNYINDNIQNSINNSKTELDDNHHNNLKNIEQTKIYERILNEKEDSKSMWNDSISDPYNKYSYIDDIINNENSISKNRKFSPFFGKPNNLNIQKNKNFENLSQNIFSNLKVFQLNIQLDESTWKHITFSYEDLLDEKVMKFIKDNKLKQIFLHPIKEKMEYMLQNDIIKRNINITEFL
ncbi:conserved Plasmodium protein, unknown function [Plasmodium gallinaceum]|uniref:Uncharacterized protein n=1 Tax=Plasmodium gallinaceum TaxID=5849 RepID=A0A1J1GWK1_PLAGA|nr:conserved Plasmodium protein, unknown function [Plasmodium gallinaceum]CRG95685.1 conserved Plasmodium protein, unknown function [Plasmodium gallinaceum]